MSEGERENNKTLSNIQYTILSCLMFEEHQLMLGDREHNITTTAAAAKLDSVTHLRKMFVCLGKNVVCVCVCCVCVR